MTLPDPAALEAILGLAFNDHAYLEQALVHRSYLNENPEVPLASNERMEFLGDAILGYITADYLYAEHPDLAEGDMTTLRAALARRETLARWAGDVSLGEHLYMGRGEASTGGRERPRILAGAFEALVAAIALDGGLETARIFLLPFIVTETARVLAEQSAKDFKSRLQEVVQATMQLTPTYRVVELIGPEHDRTFVVEALAGEEVLGRGSGHSKRIAEQEAARAAARSFTTGS
ncbi:MAG: ribonuclease III [Chloroflexota bacterium]